MNRRFGHAFVVTFTSAALLAVGASACEESTTGADFMALVVDASQDVATTDPSSDAMAPAKEAGTPQFSQCLTCIVQNCQEQISLCGPPCAAALLCMENCSTLSCQDECIRDANVVGVAGLKACTTLSCLNECPIAQANAIGVINYATATCNRYAACSPENLKYSYGTLAGCQQALIGYYGWQATLPGSGANGIRFTDCANATLATDCDDYFSARIEFTCQIRGKRGIGEPCLSAVQCESGFCPTAYTGACGKCEAPPAVGAACATGTWCGWGQLCVAGKCRIPARGLAGCSADLPCEGRYYCEDSLCIAKPRSVGAACSSARPCDDNAGLICSSPTGGTCLAYTVSVEGGACGTSGSNRQYCAHAATCSGSRCAAGPTEGQACNNETGPLCTFPEQCLNNKCVSLPAAGSCR